MVHASWKTYFNFKSVPFDGGNTPMFGPFFSGKKHLPLAKDIVRTVYSCYI